MRSRPQLPGAAGRASPTVTTGRPQKSDTGPYPGPIVLRRRAAREAAAGESLAPPADTASRGGVSVPAARSAWKPSCNEQRSPSFRERSALNSKTQNNFLTYTGQQLDTSWHVAAQAPLLAAQVP